MDDFGFGDVDLTRSLSLRFTGTRARFVGGPLSMANLKILKFNLRLDLFDNLTERNHFSRSGFD